MSWFYRRCLRPILFTQDSEAIHNRTLRGLGWASRHKLACDMVSVLYGSPELPVELFGLKFPNPVGLAAGMDKHAQAVPIWPSLGFGFSELGGVTWHAQPGNPAPRMFRAVADEALINRMGFNNSGATAVAEKLSEWKRAGRWPAHPVGINLGKSKVTPLEKAAEDYANSFQALRELADFFVINVSSPNTPNLRQLQDKEALNEILIAVREQNQSSRKPVLVKVAPDLTLEALDDVLGVVVQHGLAGIVATNTTIARPEGGDDQARKTYSETGGLSGKPLRARSVEVIRHLHRQAPELPIIGVGGIFDVADAWDKIAAGASLIQVYTGFVYEGPGLASVIVTGLRDRLADQGMRHFGEAIAFYNMHSKK